MYCAIFKPNSCSLTHTSWHVHGLKSKTWLQLKGSTTFKNIQNISRSIWRPVRYNTWSQSSHQWNRSIVPEEVLSKQDMVLAVGWAWPHLATWPAQSVPISWAHLSFKDSNQHTLNFEYFKSPQASGDILWCDIMWHHIFIIDKCCAPCARLMIQFVHVDSFTDHTCPHV